jgi:carboxypeptidase Q
MISKLILATALCAAAGNALAQQPTRAPTTAGVPQRVVDVPANDDIVNRIIQEGTHRSHVEQDLSYMLDVIGPRLAGTPEMRRANDWTLGKFREYGMDRAELERFSFGVPWTRGRMTLRMLAPQRREMIGVSWAWAPGTNGPVAGNVVYLDARTRAEFDQRFAGKLRGAWVMIGPSTPILNPDAIPTHADSVRLDSLRKSQVVRTDDEVHYQQVRGALLIKEGIAGAIRGAEKEFGLLTMSGSPTAVLPYPMIVIGNEDYAQLERLAQRGEPTRLEVDIKNTLGSSPVDQYNTVAEIRGTEKPDEVVLIGAHLDSWDLATGGTDNGTGAIAVLETARILKAAGVKPKRTIRFVLFGAEEEGLLGSQAYTAAHEKELDKFQAVLVLDNGTGNITGMALQGREELRDMWKAMLRPAAELGTLVLHSGNKTGTDHLAFLPYGVPSFNYDQATRGYNHTHHSQVDDYDHTVPSDVAQAATIMAINAWQFADMRDLLPRGPKS